MRVWKRLLFYLILNVLVSAVTTLLVINWWEKRSTPEVASGTPVVILVTTTPMNTQALDVLPILEKQLDETPQPTLDLSIPTPTIEVFTYYVKSGDTLGTIAAAYEIKMADILAVNEIDDPDSLFIGQKIYIPTSPLPTQAPPMTSTQTLTPTLTATPPATIAPQPSATHTPQRGPADMQIVTVVGAGDLESERVLLRRSGGGELSLAGWQLADQDGNVYSFPQLTLYQDGAVNVYSRLGQDTVVDLYWGLTTSVWAAGETVTLYDAYGQVRASFTLP